LANLSGRATYENGAGEIKPSAAAYGRGEALSGRGAMDLQFLLLTILLLGIGVIMVLSASFASAYYDPTKQTGGNAAYYFIRQSVFALAGVGFMFLFSYIPMAFYRRTSMWLLVISIGLLAAVPIIGTGEEVGAKRWIDLGFTTFQPSEIVKAAIVLAFAAMICGRRYKMKTFKQGILPFAVILLIIVVLLLIEPHMSASIIVISIGAVMLFLGGARLYWFLGGIGLIGILGVMAMTMPFLKHASSRITVWLDPLAAYAEAGTRDAAFQIVQSLYAVGSGGLLGLGLGQSRQKYLYLPEEHNDFIFSIICEELGFIGALLILALFAMFIVRGYYIALHCKDRYSSLVCAGITTLFALQIFFNVAVVTNLIPATGISLPFFSYGGTALIIQLAEIGIILSLSRDIPAKKQL